MRMLAITLTLGFIWLSYYSLHHASHEAAGYAPEDIDALNDQVAALTLTPPSLKQRQARALADVYRIDESEITKPVRIFGE